MPQNGAGGVPGAPPAVAPQPTGGAPGQTPPAATPPTAAVPDYRSLHDQAQQKLAAVEKERERERLDRLKADKAREKDETDHKRDPIKPLQSVLGEDWYDAATKLKTGTVAPGSVSSALADLEQRLETKFAEREKAREAEIAELRARDNERQRQEYFRGAAEHVKANPDKYPLLHAFK